MELFSNMKIELLLVRCSSKASSALQFYLFINRISWSKMCNQKRTEQTKMHKITNAPDSETQNYTVKNLLALMKNA